eukprot:364347-Chlamydomonas_euryale.AAC.13
MLGNNVSLQTVTLVSALLPKIFAAGLLLGASVVPVASLHHPPIQLCAFRAQRLPAAAFRAQRLPAAATNPLILPCGRSSELPLATAP